MKLTLWTLILSLTVSSQSVWANVICSSIEKDFGFYQTKQNNLREENTSNCANTTYEEQDQFTPVATVESEAAAAPAPAPVKKAVPTKRCMNLTELQVAYDKAMATKVLIEGLKAIKDEMVQSFENTVLNFKLGTDSGATDAQTFAKDFQEKTKALSEESNKQLKLNKEKYETLASLRTFMESPYNSSDVHSPITNVETLNNRCLDILDNLNFSFLSRDKKTSVSDMQSICKDLKQNQFNPSSEPLKSLVETPVNATKLKNMDAKSAIQGECTKLDGFFKSPNSPQICVKLLSKKKDDKEAPEVNAALNGFFEAYNRLEKSNGAKKNAAKTIFDLTGFGSADDVKKYDKLLSEFNKLQALAHALKYDMDKCLENKLGCAFDADNFRKTATGSKPGSISSISTQLKKIEEQKVVVLKSISDLKGPPDLSKSELTTKINEFIEQNIKDKYTLFLKQKKEWQDNLSSGKSHTAKQASQSEPEQFSEARKKAESSLEKECTDLFKGVAESLTSKLKVDCKSYTFLSCPANAKTCETRVSLDKLFTDKNSVNLPGVKDLKGNQPAKTKFDDLNKTQTYAKNLAELEKAGPKNVAKINAIKNDPNFKAKYAEYEAATQPATSEAGNIEIDIKIINNYKQIKARELSSVSEEFNTVCNRLFERNEKSKEALGVNCEAGVGALTCASTKKDERATCEKVKAHFEKNPDFKKLRFLLIKKDKINESLNVLNDPKNQNNFGAQKEIIYKKLYEDFKSLLAIYGKTCNETIRPGENSDGLQDKALQIQINLMNCINENGNLDKLASKSEKQLAEIKKQLSDITKSDPFIFWEKAKMLHYNLFNQQCVTRKKMTIEDTAYAQCDKSGGEKPLSVKNYMIDGSKIIGKMIQTYVDNKPVKIDKFKNVSDFCSEVNSYLKSDKDSKASAEEFKMCNGHFSDIKRKDDNEKYINYYNPQTMQLMGRQERPSLAAPIMGGVTQGAMGSLTAVMNNQIDDARINYMGAVATFNQQTLINQQVAQNNCWALLAQGKSCTSAYYNPSLPYTGYNFGGLPGQLPYSSINYPYPSGSLVGSPSLFQFSGATGSSIYYRK